MNLASGETLRAEYLVGCDGGRSLICKFAAPTAVLVRPDGYVAWVGEGTDAGGETAKQKLFGGANPHNPTKVKLSRDINILFMAVLNRH